MNATLLGQSVIGGVLAGGLYGLLALGLSLSWGLLRLVNLSHFALAFLGAYLTYQFGSVYGLAPWWSAAIILPMFFLFGIGLHWLFLRFRVAEMASMLVTFGIALFIESMIQWYWTADFRRYESGYGNASIHMGPFFVPTLDLAALTAAVAMAGATWGWLQFTLAGKALRASAEDGQMAAAFGINHRRLSFLLAGLCSVYAGVAGVFIALISTLAPSEIGAWIGVIFAVVIIGGLGNPLGAVLGGILVGVSEQLTMAELNPAWAPLVSFALLITLLLLNPRWL